MLNAVFLTVIIHLITAILCRGQTMNVFSFSPNPLNSKYDSNDVIKIGFADNNFTLGFSVCLRIMFFTWNTSAALQTSDGLLILVKLLTCFLSQSSPEVLKLWVLRLLTHFKVAKYIVMVTQVYQDVTITLY